TASSTRSRVHSSTEMAEIRDFLFPDLGEGLTEGEIVSWLVAVGDRVTVDQPVAEVSTEKAAVQVPVPFAGVVVSLHGEAGGTVQVGAPLISIDVAAPVTAGAAAAPPPGVHVEPGTVRSAAPGSGNVLVGYGTTGEAVRGRRRVRSATGNGSAPVPAPRSHLAGPPAGHESAPPAARPAAAAAVVAASPLVRRRAALAGVDLTSIRGTGPHGAVSQGDLERHLQPPGTAETPPGPGPAGERVPLTGVRRITAERLGRSHREAPDATAWLSADATALLALRDLLSTRQGVHVTPLAVLLRLCVAALQRHPSLNSHVDPASGDTVIASGVHLGVAVQADRGLLVPVVRDAQRRSVVSMAAELNRLAAAAREGRLTSSEMGGSTFTVSNFGAFGVDGGSAIINPPEAAILGVGRIGARPWVVGTDVVVRPVVELSLVFDHRACDGGTAGGFLRLLADLVEHPELVAGEAEPMNTRTPAEDRRPDAGERGELATR
ncbi:MAG: dihydrolipoamide acetyltransferase family protein, partial [Candidatus Dormibacteria bacterium]